MALRVMRISMSNKLKLAITIGDPSGIGPEVTLKAILRLSRRQLERVVVIGSKFVLSKFSRIKSGEFELIDLDNVDRANFAFGKIRPEFGRAALGYLDKALELWKSGKINSLVTAPVSKEAINLAGMKFSGHTEYLASKTKAKKIAMMFVAHKLKIALVTRHLALKDVPRRITKGNIIDTILLTSKFLKNNYGIRRPRIAVCGLNPHAGEGGLLGDEEEKIIKPAIIKARNYADFVYGPFPADTLFLKVAEFDAIIAMYHDQGMIPIKISAFSSCVNVTLGLPFIRTSPCHGTAFDIAGKNKADYSSMLCAIQLASFLDRKSLCCSVN